MAKISDDTGLSRQTIWRMAKKQRWPQPQGGRRARRCKIPTTLNTELWEKIQAWRTYGKPYAAQAVDWLRERGIQVTLAAIYTWTCRLNEKRRKTKKAVGYAEARARRREASRETVANKLFEERQGSDRFSRTGRLWR